MAETIVHAGRWLVVLPVLVPFLVLVHETGHALACKLLRHPVHELRVGDEEPVLTVNAGGFRLRLGAVTGRRPVGGYVRYDGTRAGARDILIIALAGPLASLAIALAGGWAYVSAPSHPLLLLCVLTGGLMDCVRNLTARGDAHGVWSDGQLAKFAWRALRRPVPPPAWTDPHEATSVAPPG